jgi:hypothetical protein
MNPMWNQFRRLLLGTVVESLLEHELAIDFRTLRISFHQDSEFRVPRLDNYMRFKGSLTAALLAAPSAQAEARLETALRRAWPELLGVLDIPVGDRLGEEKNHIDVRFEHGAPARITVDFDLEAD